MKNILFIVYFLYWQVSFCQVFECKITNSTSLSVGLFENNKFEIELCRVDEDLIFVESIGNGIYIKKNNLLKLFDSKHKFTQTFKQFKTDSLKPIKALSPFNEYSLYNCNNYDISMKNEIKPLIKYNIPIKNRKGPLLGKYLIAGPGSTFSRLELLTERDFNFYILDILVLTGNYTVLGSKLYIKDRFVKKTFVLDIKDKKTLIPISLIGTYNKKSKFLYSN